MEAGWGGGPEMGGKKAGPAYMTMWRPTNHCPKSLIHGHRQDVHLSALSVYDPIYKSEVY